MSEVAMEEISALAAIYSEKDEFELLDMSEKNGITFRIQICVQSHLEDVHLKLTFYLQVSYPECQPDISVISEQLTRTQCFTIKEALLKKAASLLSEPMVHELVVWLQQNFNDIIEHSQKSICKEKESAHSSETLISAGSWTVLLRLDHMRAKEKYIRTIKKWAFELKLSGKLMFMGKLILILLQGDKNSIKEYLMLQKTVKVDVDSSGKKCKEKMMSILYETLIQQGDIICSGFEVKEYTSLAELQTEFEVLGLSKMYQEFVPALFV
ncbi:RWD domain-containing protein 3 [Protopterus annectens]|uniref:RWD domain-containing protein 3 n=1 Tax=Protopterus annectens TaxID=7888 RepID=UPI001CFB6116|nr:RWD domain-containing protein 3 [Protopterus annectens]